MAFYIAKGLQLAGLIGVGGALFAGLTAGVSLTRELMLAGVGMGLFYAGRLLEPSGS